MKSRALAILVAMTLCSCATLGEGDRQILLRQKVSASLLQKMHRSESLTLNEIVELSKKNVPPPVIVRYIDGTLEEYQLKTEDVLNLRRAGVNNAVIDYLLSTAGASADPMIDRDPFWWDRSYRQPIIIHRHRRR
jgi:hypothetical protein